MFGVLLEGGKQFSCVLSLSVLQGAENAFSEEQIHFDHISVAAAVSCFRKLLSGIRYEF